jgi:ribonuclease P protein component
MPGLSKSQRLLTKRDFDATLDTQLNGTGVKIVCRDFVLVASPPVPDRPARLGLIVSRKVGNSVVRNRVKRCVREYFRNELVSEKPLEGCSLVVIARPALVNQEGRVKDDIQGSLKICVGRLLKKLSESSKART